MGSPPPREQATSPSGFRVNPQHNVLFGIFVAFTFLLVVFLFVTFLGCCRAVRTVPSSDEKSYKERRRRTIQQWTITKPAVDHDYSKVMQQRSHAGSCYPSDEEEGDTDGTDSCCSSMDESDANENKIQTCSICLEAFHVGERVSWSSTNLCDHGFHPFCIQEWLIRHEDCPMCRQRFMLCDFSGKRVPTTMLRVLRKEYKKRKEETCFSIHDGLMNLKGAGEKCNDDNGTCLCERFSGDSEEMKEDDAVRAEKGCSKALNTTMPLESDEEDENGPCV